MGRNVFRLAAVLKIFRRYAATSLSHHGIPWERFKLAFKISSISALRFFDPQLLNVFVNRRVEVLDEDAREGGLLFQWKRPGLSFDVLKVCTHAEIITETHRPVGTKYL